MLHINWNWYYLVVPASCVLSFLFGFLSWKSQDCQVQRRIPAGHFRLAQKYLPATLAFVNAYMIIIESHRGIMSLYLHLAPGAEDDGWVGTVYLIVSITLLILISGSSDGLLRLGRHISYQHASKKACAYRKNCQSQTPYQAMVSCKHKTMRCPCGFDDPETRVTVKAHYVRSIAREDGDILVSQGVYLVKDGMSDKATDTESVPARLFIVPASFTQFKRSNQKVKNQRGA